MNNCCTIKKAASKIPRESLKLGAKFLVPDLDSHFLERYLPDGHVFRFASKTDSTLIDSHICSAVKIVYVSTSTCSTYSSICSPEQSF